MRILVRTVVLLLCGAIVGNLYAVTPASSDGWTYDSSTMRLKIADASTRVSIARVNLKITGLMLEEGRLTGNYDMRVPLSSSNDEKGLIDLSFSQQISDLRQSGGLMEGVGICKVKEEDPRKIVCEIIPHHRDKDRGRIVLKIDTGERILTFNTTYTVEKVGVSS